MIEFGMFEVKKQLAFHLLKLEIQFHLILPYLSNTLYILQDEFIIGYR